MFIWDSVSLDTCLLHRTTTHLNSTHRRWNRLAPTTNNNRVNRNFHFDFPADRQCIPDRPSVQCSSQFLDGMALSAVAGKSQKSKPRLLWPALQATVLPCSLSSPVVIAARISALTSWTCSSDSASVSLSPEYSWM